MRFFSFQPKNRELRAEVRALKLALSSSDKKQNRLSDRVKVLEERCVKHHAQQRHDQTYIDKLEAQLTDAQIKSIRDEMRTS